MHSQPWGAGAQALLVHATYGTQAPLAHTTPSLPRSPMVDSGGSLPPLGWVWEGGAPPGGGDTRRGRILAWSPLDALAFRLFHLLHDFHHAIHMWGGSQLIHQPPLPILIVSFVQGRGDDTQTTNLFYMFSQGKFILHG